MGRVRVKRRVREYAARGVSRPGQYHLGGRPLLLDTHVWIWWMENDWTRACAGTVELLERAERTGDLLVSDISHWEVAVKAAKGKMRLAMDAIVWLDRAAAAPGFSSCSLSREVLLQSTRLAGSVHGDPADRMLIATAQLRGIPLVTADKAIIGYAERHSGLHVIDVRRR
jgi:PIN domain nuclease of toxin-antitoxin system